MKIKNGISSAIVGIEISIFRKVTAGRDWLYTTSGYAVLNSGKREVSNGWRTYQVEGFTKQEVLQKAKIYERWPRYSFLRMLEVWHKVSPALFQRGYRAKPKLLQSLAGFIGAANCNGSIQRGHNGEWHLVSLQDFKNLEILGFRFLSEEGIKNARIFAKEVAINGNGRQI